MLINNKMFKANEIFTISIANKIYFTTSTLRNLYKITSSLFLGIKSNFEQVSFEEMSSCDGELCDLFIFKSINIEKEFKFLENVKK